MSASRSFVSLLQILILLSVIGLNLGILEVKADDLITTPLDELLPSREDIPTQWFTGIPSNVTVDEPGFMECKMVNYYRRFGTSIMSLSFYVYRFSSTASAEAYCNNEINEIKLAGGYTEVAIPGVFAVIIDFGHGIGEMAISWGNISNIVFKVNIFNTYSPEYPEDELIYFTNLEKGIIPEFPSFILLPLFMLGTFLAAIIFRKTRETRP